VGSRPHSPGHARRGSCAAPPRPRFTAGTWARGSRARRHDVGEASRLRPRRPPPSTPPPRPCRARACLGSLTKGAFVQGSPEYRPGRHVAQRSSAQASAAPKPGTSDPSLPAARRARGVRRPRCDRHSKARRLTPEAEASVKDLSVAVAAAHSRRSPYRSSCTTRRRPRRQRASRIKSAAKRSYRPSLRGGAAADEGEGRASRCAITGRRSEGREAS